MIVETILGIAIALIIDFSFGDPKNKFHPTSWLGSLIGRLAFVQNKVKDSKSYGIFLTLIISVPIACFAFLINADIYYISTSNFHFEIYDFLLTLICSLLIGILLKTTIAIKGMQAHGQQVMDALKENNLLKAREKLSLIVKRDTKNLDRPHIISATLESISENTVDGITGPLFYFGIFGLPGAFVYRTINTIDSMIGYKTEQFRNLGWFGANCDKILNYLPSRLTSLIMVLSALIIGKNWKHSFEIMKRDGPKTESPNAGYPMSTLAGALDVRFEKIDYYVLGDGKMDITENHFKASILIMKLTAFLFSTLVTVPSFLFFYSLGLWLYV